MRGDLARATTLYEAALAIMQEEGIQWGMAMTITLLDHLAHQQRQFAEAKARYRESLALFRAFGSAPFTAWCLEGLAATFCAQGCFARATRLLAVKPYDGARQRRE